ncbi:MAG TPA: transglycosylase SLT domain-containing protein [Kofleriaceae bacterium]|nr:transglycosylase SLT domain-containing protein [Kofleriaceae bacterium]
MRALVGPCSILVASVLGCSGGCRGAKAPAASAPTVQAQPAPQVAGDAAVAAAPVVPEPPVAALTEDLATPYFREGPGAAAAARFALEDWPAAADGFTALEQSLPITDVAGRGRAALLAGLAEAGRSQWRAAADDLARARVALPLLDDWIGYQEARARYFAHDPAGALALARAVDPASIAGTDAALLIGDILRGGDDVDAVITHYRGYLDAHPSGPRKSEARFRLAEALDRAGVASTLAERIAIYRAITVEDPLSSWATRAQARLTAIGGAATAPLSATELIARGKVYFDAMRNPEGEADFAAALARPEITAAERCVASYHRAQSLFKARDRVHAAPRFDEAIAACKAAGDHDLEVRSAYQAGRSYAYNGDHSTALARYQAAETAGPDSSYADDALLREAEEYADLGDDAKVTAALESLPVKYPQGDMKAEALWRLGWRAYRAGDDARAIGYWRQQIAAAPIDDNYWAEGQPQYWIGRAQALAGDAAGAVRSWEDAVRTYPVSYYAMLSLNRLAETAPAQHDALVAEISADPPGFDPKAPAFQFKPRPEYATLAFARATELIRLGLGDPADAELRGLGLTPPSDKKRVDDPDRIEKLWAMAWLYDRAGRYSTSHWPTRWHILDYKRQWPVGANRARWRIAYPLAYYPLLSEQAAKNGAPVAMLQAIVREESAFDPLTESYANAVGLTQMIHSTATRFAKGTGIDPTRENLRDPEKNVTIGSRFLGFLFTQWKGFAHLVPPSYNAGEGAVKRMLKLRGTWPADEFIEGIVDDQARNYSKRVLASYFAYTWLDDGKVPVMPNTIPAGLIPAH